jgi:hypothetical protein
MEQGEPEARRLAPLAHQLHDLVNRCEGTLTEQECLKSLDAILGLYEQVSPDDGAAARQVRLAFLTVLRHLRKLELDAETRHQIAHFLAQQVEAEDFGDLRWHSPEEVVAYGELLYSFKYDDPELAKRTHGHAHALLTQALLDFERDGDLEKLFTLFRLAPTTPAVDDREFHRLRSRAYVYEMRRVQHRRRWLYGYLALQILLIAIVFPLLFINAENGALQDRIEQSAQVDLPEEARRYFTYADGLYWALITAASIGYGDITPQTDVGRLIAAILGVMGVITVGVIAGLILDWISPRSID